MYQSRNRAALFLNWLWNYSDTMLSSTHGHSESRKAKTRSKPKENQMKRIIAALAMSAAFATAAVAAPTLYHFSSSESFSTYNVYKVEPFDSGRQVRVYYINGGENFYTDKTGDLLARILENQPELTKITGTESYVNPEYAARVNCSAGTSTVSLQNSGIAIRAADNCLLANEIAAKAK